MNNRFQFLLWLNALVFCVYLAAHLFDLFILIPNWRSGSVEEITTFNAFFHKTNPYDFYRVIMPVSTGLSVVCFLLYLRSSAALRILLFISLAIDTGIYLVTLHYFLPINEYLFLEESGQWQPERVQEYVRAWLTADYLRIGLIVVGFYTSILSLHYSYKISSPVR